MAKRKKHKVSPDELLFNFADWTEPVQQELTLFPQETPYPSSQVAPHPSPQTTFAPSPQVIPHSSTKLQDGQSQVELPQDKASQDDGSQNQSSQSQSSQVNESNQHHQQDESCDLQYMEDTMFWALRQIDGIDDKNQSRLIAMESASLALGGISLHNIYQLQSYSYGRIDGYQLIALYYASFAQVFPNMLSGIKLPYAPQFETAQKRFQEFVRRP